MKRRAAILQAAILSIGAAMAAGPALAAEAPPDRAKAQTETLKERLSDKASDDQRVNNCRVPPEKRGPKKRPVDCPGERPTQSSARSN